MRVSVAPTSDAISRKISSPIGLTDPTRIVHCALGPAVRSRPALLGVGEWLSREPTVVVSKFASVDPFVLSVLRDCVCNECRARRHEQSKLQMCESQR